MDIGTEIVTDIITNNTLIYDANSIQVQLSACWHVLIIASFVVCAFLGNGITISIHIIKRKSYQSKLLVIALAFIDLFACTAVLPLYPFIDRNLISEENFLVLKIWYGLNIFVFIGNIFLLLLIAFDRFIAVYFPYRYTQYGGGHLTILSILLVTDIVASSLAFAFRHYDMESTVNKILDAISFIFLIVPLILLSILYILIIIKLFKQGRQISVATNSYNRNTFTRNTTLRARTNEQQMPTMRM